MPHLSIRASGLEVRGLSFKIAIAFIYIGFLHSTMALRLFFITSAVQVGEVMDEGTPGDKHLRKIAMHVSAYIAHVRTQLKQTIPKAIVHCLVRRKSSHLTPTPRLCFLMIME